MNTRKRTLTPNQQLQSMLGMLEVKNEEEYDSKEHSPFFFTNADEPCQPIKKRLTTKSVLWSLFTGNDTHYFCTLCPGRNQSFKNPASTTVAMRHVKRFHTDHPKVQDLLRENPDFLKSNGLGTPTTIPANKSFSSNSPTGYFDALNLPKLPTLEVKKPKQIQFEASLSKLLSLPNMPVEMVVSPEMREVFQCLDLKMPLPSNVQQLKEILFEQSMEIKQKLRNELFNFKGSLSSTLGAWTMEESFGFTSTYVTVMVHFIDGEQLKHRFLGGQKLPQSSISNIGMVYKQILDEYSLDLTDIYRTCVNGTSAIVNAFVNYDDNLQNQFISAQNSPNESKPTTSIQKLEPIQLETFFFDKDSNEIDEFVNLLNDDQCHPCISHDLKLVLFNTIKESLIKSAEFQRMLGLFDKFQNSHTAMTDLLSMIGQVFVQINKHEWSSWISALEYYMQHRHLMAQISSQQNWEQLTDKENDLLKQYLDVLSVFRYSIKTLENNENPSLSWVYGIIRVLNEKLSSIKQAGPIKKMCEIATKQMKQRLAYVQEDPIFVICAFFDPATKNHLKAEDAERATELIADWLKLEDAETSMMSFGEQEESNSNSNDPLLQMLDSFGPKQSDTQQFVRSFVELIGAEFQRQSDKGKYSSTTLKILQSATTDSRYERIIKIARIVLSVPTSNTCSESEFIHKHHYCQSKEDDNDVLSAKLLIHLNNSNC